MMLSKLLSDGDEPLEWIWSFFMQAMYGSNMSFMRVLTIELKC